jgi:putative flavoprotein involved in K+ transport
MSTEQIETVIIGAGQAGLATGYHLAQRGQRFVILDAHDRIGDTWRTRWDSLRLFTPARYDGLPGLPYPGHGWSFPTRGEFADYLRDYAAHWRLPVRTGVRVHKLHYDGAHYVIETADQRYEADNVVIATGFDRLPKIPEFAAALDPGLVQLHAGDYRNASQLNEGDVLVVGAGNSGADIALDLAPTHRVLLSGRHPGQIPWRIEGRAARLFTPALFFAFSHLLTVRTPMGRKLRPRVLAHSGPLIRVKAEDLTAAGVERVPRTVGARDGLPQLADGRTPRIANVVWCTGFRPDTSWIDLPVFGPDGQPRQHRGIADSQPGLYFVGQLFQYALASSMVRGVGRDADHIAGRIADRAGERDTAVPVAIRRA